MKIRFRWLLAVLSLASAHGLAAESPSAASSSAVRDSATLAVTLQVPYEHTLTWLADPLHHIAWNSGFFSGPGTRGARWNEARANVPALGGPVRLRIETHRSCGAFEVYFAPGTAPFPEPAQVRLVRNGDGVDVLWTIHRASGASEEEWQGARTAMQQSLQRLKARLEAPH